MGTFFGVPIIRARVFEGLYWGSFVLGNYHIWPKLHGTLKQSCGTLRSRSAESQRTLKAAFSLCRLAEPEAVAAVAEAVFVTPERLDLQEESRA